MVRDILQRSLVAALIEVGVHPPPYPTIQVAPTDRRDHGDWASNVALTMAKAAGRKPRDLADAIKDYLTANPPTYVTKVDVAGPGFLNLWLDDAWLHDVLRLVVLDGEKAYAAPDVGHGQRLNVEFVSANPTGPLHVGAGRWAAYGDAVCRLFERCGYHVHREYLLNDRGNQVDLFGKSIEARRDGTALPEGGYQGEYVADWAAEMPVDADPVQWGYERAVRDARDTLEAIGVHFDTWFSERSMVASGAIEAALNDLRAHGYVYEADGATWLRTTDLGLEKDEVLLKTGGEPTYLLSDIAYHRDKFERGSDHLIDIWGADHHGHINRLKAGMQALGHDPDDLEILLGQLVAVQRGGEIVRMGRRRGNFVELAEIVDEVGADVARLTFLLQSIDTRQVFDIDTVVRQSMDNPVYYVQYAHARIASIGRMAAERGVERRPLEDVDLGVLTHERELDLLRSLAELPDVVAEACRTRAPHKVTTWVRELAGRFHGFLSSTLGS